MPDHQPFLSVITVCFNAGSTIRRTLDSLREQTSDNFEVIIIDGGSTDNTIEIVKSYTDLQAHIISEKDAGIYDAMNKGVKLARGNYVAFLNADDCYLPDTVHHLQNASAHKEVDIFYGDIQKVRIYRGRHFTKIATPYLPDMPKTMAIFHPASFVKRQLFFTLGLFDIHYKLAADYHWFLRAYLNAATFEYIPMVMANFFIGGKSNFSCESYREAAMIQQHFNTGYDIEMQNLYSLCQRKAQRQRIIKKVVSVWPFNFIYSIYLHRKWR